MIPRPHPHPRRGNAMILVAGILALLVIIATAYITRTQGGRITGVAVQRAQQRDNGAEAVANMIANEITDALFVWPVDPFDPFVDPTVNPSLGAPLAADSNFPRLQPDKNALRYGVDRDFIDRSSGTPVFNQQDGIPDFPYNFAPYSTVPYTNWPDFFEDPDIPFVINDTFIKFLLPAGPGNPSLTGWQDGNPFVYNPPGNPGFGDSRWLANFEPLRWTTGNSLDTMQDSIYQPDAFSHWLHLTNLSRPNNGWRILTDISDIGDHDNNGLGIVLTNLTLPIEQWLPITSAQRKNIGDNGYTNPVNFMAKWRQWFGLDTISQNTTQMVGYLNAFGDTNNAATNPFNHKIPPNFYRLKDANANGTVLEPGEFPLDEFMGPGMKPGFTDGTPRWNIGRILADTDGDGFTDAFWHLAPVPAVNGQMTIVAVRIIDNSAMLNVNVATAFRSDDQTINNIFIPTATTGATPADLALAGAAAPVDFNNPFSGHVNVGFYDNPEHWFNTVQDFGYDTSIWTERRHQNEIGLLDANNDGYSNAAERLDYWLRAGNRPLYPDPTSPYTPFSLDNELALRMFSGNDNAWNFTGFEWSVQDFQPSASTDFLRASQWSEESIELSQDRKDNRMLVRDSRHRLTMYSATRNDLLPPWLWPNLTEGPWIDWNNDGDATDPVEAAALGVGIEWIDFNNNFFVDPGEAWFADYNNNGVFDPGEEVKQWQDSDFLKMDLRFRPGKNTNTNFNWSEARRTYRNNLRNRFERLLIVPDPNSTNPLGGYLQTDADTAPDTDQQTRLREMAAALAANIDSYRDARDFDYEDPDFPEDIDENPVDVDQNNNPVSFPTPAGFNPAPVANSVRVRDENGNEIFTDPDPSIPDYTTPILGMEAQPFLVEAFLCHVHGSELIPPNFNDAADPDFGRYVDSSMDQITISVVQIANPSGKPIDLTGYAIKWFGQIVKLKDINPDTTPGAKFILLPGTAQNPVTFTFASIAPNDPIDDPFGVTNFRDLWLDFLDLQPADLHPDSWLILDDDLNPKFSHNRGSYDDFILPPNPLDPPPPEPPLPPIERVVELIRLDDTGPNPLQVVVDRFDYNSSTSTPQRDQFYRYATPTNSDLPDEHISLPPPASDPAELPALQGIRIPLADDVWVTWARVTRVWGRDGSADITKVTSDLDGLMTPRDESPRFVFAEQSVAFPNREWDDAKIPPPPQIQVFRGDTIGRPGDPVAIPPIPPIPPDLTDYYGASFNLAGLNGPAIPPDGTILPIDYDNIIPNPWFVSEYQDESGSNRIWKPTFFTPPPYHAFNQDPIPVGVVGFETFYAHKGFYGTNLDYPLQMLQKDGDFQQLGELLNVWNIGHKIKMVDVALPPDPPEFEYDQTIETFSEQLSDLNLEMPQADSSLPPGSLAWAEALEVSREAKIRIGRLTVQPTRINDPTNPKAIISPIVGFNQEDFPDGTGTGLNYYSNPLNAHPNLPAGARLFEAFVCDGIGVNPWHEKANPLGDKRFDLASNFTGKPTHGLINISTAPPEVMQALPHLTKIVHRSPNSPGLSNQPKSMIPEAIIQYRNHLDGDNFLAFQGHLAGPDYSVFHDWIINPAPGAQDPIILNPDPNPDNHSPLMNVRRETGFASVGELMLLDMPGYFDPLAAPPFSDVPHLNQGNDIFPDAWRINFAASDPFDETNFTPFNQDAVRPTARLSTDVVGPDNNTDLGDGVSGDAEEANLLFAGISNLVTTRSDTFTVYFKIRTFKQNPISGVWDATDPEMIVDQARYVMLLDRSTVNKPTDKPKILYLEKLPQ